MESKERERWQHVRTVFEAVDSANSDQRDALLEELCGDDHPLRAEVEQLLASGGSRGAFLMEPAVPEESDVELKSIIGEAIGPFVISRLIGKGGMGAVFEALQLEPVKRRVAIKLIRPGFDSREMIRRFERERQNLAEMNHPNVAGLLQADLARGQPYFAMEYVAGSPITEFCDKKRLSVRERLGLFCQVCAGVQHAHEKLVIHRDLKPSNILVEDTQGGAVPRIIDFGLARPITTGEDSSASSAALGSGTDAYMSPEQRLSSGRAPDTRSDVYALGAVLFEILHGRPLNSQGITRLDVAGSEYPPALRDGKAVPEGDALDEIAAARGSNRRHLPRVLGGDLHCIVAKATDLTPENRYESAAALAADIHRYLAKQPIEAGPNSVAYRVKKFISRHRLLSAAALIAAASLALGAIGLSFGLVRAKRSEAAATAASERARESLLFLIDTFEIADPGRSRSQTVTAQEILDSGVSRLRSANTQDPQTTAALAHTLGRLYLRIGRPDEARPLLEQSVGGWRAEPTASAELSESLNNLAEVYRLDGEFEKADAAHREALDLRTRVFGRTSSEVADSLNELGLLRWNQGDLPSAEALLTEAREIWEQMDDPELASALSNLSLVLRQMGRYKEAEPPLRKALALFEAEEGPDHPEVLATKNNLAELNRVRGDWDTAERQHSELVDATLRVLGARHPSHLAALNNLGVVHRSQGRFAEAEELFQQCLEIDRELFGEAHRFVGDDHHNLGVLYRLASRYVEAEESLLRSKRIYIEVLGEEHRAVASSLAELGLLYRVLGRIEEAQHALSRSLELRVASFGRRHPSTVKSMVGLGRYLAEEGRPKKARELLEEALVIGEEVWGGDHPSFAEALKGLAALEIEEGNRDTASQLLNRALVIEERSLVATHPELAVTRGLLAGLE